ncbi:MAG: hypothetical protein CM15mP45_11140 [Deltaproteobacteria bacterium]|nr:MAG: hypothetical protein CM15mP45_11140 [Deltaproteobacteria bacterium]
MGKIFLPLETFFKAFKDDMVLEFRGRGRREYIVTHNFGKIFMGLNISIKRNLPPKNSEKNWRKPEDYPKFPGNPFKKGSKKEKRERFSPINQLISTVFGRKVRSYDSRVS